MSPGEQVILNIDQEKIYVFDLGNAHSLNDCVVDFEERKLLMAGDMVFVEVYPVFTNANVT